MKKFNDIIFALEDFLEKLFKGKFFIKESQYQTLKENQNTSKSFLWAIISSLLFLFIPLFGIIALLISDRYLYNAKKKNEDKKLRNIGKFLLVIPILIWLLQISLFVIKVGHKVANDNETGAEKITKEEIHPNTVSAQQEGVNKWLDKTSISNGLARLVVSKLIPKDSFLRDLEKIPGTDKYLGIYITDYSVKENQSDIHADGSTFITCPEEIFGKTEIAGKYYLFLFDGHNIVNTISIPSYIDNQTNEMSVSLLNTKSNNSYVYGDDSNRDNYEIGYVKLINFTDYTGDNLKFEFNIAGDNIACGHISRLIAGYDLKNNKAIIYNIKNDNGSVYWFDNFIPKNDGSVKITWRCDDHGSEYDSTETFEVDRVNNSFILKKSISEKCN